jgi:hypothetical protein
MSWTPTRSQTWMIGKRSSSGKLFLLPCIISSNVVRTLYSYGGLLTAG